MLSHLANTPLLSSVQLCTLGKDDKRKGFSIFCKKNFAAPYLSLEPQKSDAEFLYLFYLLLVLQMAESAGAILICNSTVLQWTVKGRKEYSESEDKETIGKDFQKKRSWRGEENLKIKARERESRERTV